jgi:hypothetical protein
MLYVGRIDISVTMCLLSRHGQEGMCQGGRVQDTSWNPNIMHKSSRQPLAISDA